MASNLVFLYPSASIPYRSGFTTVDPGTADGYDVQDLASGPRSKMWQADEVGQTAIITWDLGSGVTATADYVYIARADLIYKQVKATTTGKVLIDSSSNGSSWTNRYTITINSSSGKGPRGEDYITTGSTSAFQFWRAQIDATDGTTEAKQILSKIFIGSSFDMGRDPAYTLPRRRPSERRDSPYELELSFEGVTDAKAASFNDSILVFSDVHPVVLYETTDSMMNTYKLMYGGISNGKITPTAKNQNKVSFTFTEQI